MIFMEFFVFTFLQCPDVNLLLKSRVLYTLPFYAFAMGFEIMCDHESFNIPFTIIQTCFPEGIVMMYGLY